MVYDDERTREIGGKFCGFRQNPPVGLQIEMEAVFLQFGIPTQPFVRRHKASALFRRGRRASGLMANTPDKRICRLLREQACGIVRVKPCLRDHGAGIAEIPRDFMHVVGFLKRSLRVIFRFAVNGCDHVLPGDIVEIIAHQVRFLYCAVIPVTMRHHDVLRQPRIQMLFEVPKMVVCVNDRSGPDIFFSHDDSP
ncbi:hypothetical protein BN1221_01344 [Brenneria goodwinii]|uniref:Uncharacterized protein n=1 Tax=Brenneria goodwinii TaxID=1109412 RepID=A0A0G4JT67_9GAMM|nr:hypothetical protein BN1221_01344 [Brenneria goodwinii]